MKKIGIAALAAVTLALWPSAARADVITDYNDGLLTLFRLSPVVGATSGDDDVDPELAAYATAMMNTAAFDAVNAVVGGYKPYIFSGKPDGTASPEAAAAQAGHDALRSLWFLQASSQTAVIDALLMDALAKIPESAEKTSGIALGKQSAAALVAARKNDGSNPAKPPPFTPGTKPGDWQPTPPMALPADKPWWGAVTSFAIPSPVSSFATPPGPPTLDSAEYAKLFNEVKDIGRKDSKTRTAAQTNLALFWSEQQPHQRTPPGSWIAIASTLAKSHSTTLIESARLFALLGLAMADAGIDAWEVKYAPYASWRPITAIRGAADDGNPATEADPTWDSLLPAPNFPAYFSGHSNFGWSAATVIQRFFGTDALTFTATSDTVKEPIAYASIAAAATDNGAARIYLGVHFSNENTDSAAVGVEVGTYVYDHQLLKADPVVPPPVVDPGGCSHTAGPAASPMWVAPLLALAAAFAASRRRRRG